MMGGWAKTLLLGLGLSLAVPAQADRFAYLPSTPSPGGGSTGLAEGELTVMNVDTGQPVASLDFDTRPVAVAVDNAGQAVFMADEGGAIYRLDTRTLNSERRFSVADAAPAALALSPDGRWLLLAGEALWLLDLAASEPQPQALAASYAGTSLAFAPDGGYAVSLLGAFGNAPGVAVLNFGIDGQLEDGAELAALPIDGGNGLAVGADGRIYIANPRGDELLVLQFDASTYSLAEQARIGLPEGSAPYDVALSGDGAHVLVTLAYNTAGPAAFRTSGEVRAYASADLQEVASLPLQNPSLYASFHPQAIAAVGNDRFALVKSLWGPGSGSVVSVLRLEPDGQGGMRLVEMEQALAVSGRDMNWTGRFVGPDCDDCPGARDHSRQAGSLEAGASGGGSKGLLGAVQPVFIGVLLLAGIWRWRRAARA